MYGGIGKNYGGKYARRMKYERDKKGRKVDSNTNRMDK
jgi:hypothetical protein